MTKQRAKKIMFIILFLISGIISFAQYSQKYSFSIQNKSLEEAIKIVENKLQLKISYDVGIIKEEKINISFSNLNNEQILLKLLRNVKLEYEFISPEYVVLNKQSRSFKKEHEKTVSLIIFDNENGISIPGAVVNVKGNKKYFMSDKFGKVAIQSLFCDDDTLYVKYLGYKTAKISVKGKFNKQYSKVKLQIKNHKIASVIISEKRRAKSLFATDKQTGGTEMNLKQFEDIGGLVEKDVLQTLHLLPGITGSDESASLFNIRGGASGQNLIMFDDIKMYHIGHFFGKVSAMNPNFVEKATVYKDCYPAQYSGRVAGIIDIRSSDKIPNKFELSAGASFISGSFSGKLPLFKKKAFIAFGYRRSFTDILNSNVNNKMFNQFFQNSIITEDQNRILHDSLSDYVKTVASHNFSDFNLKYFHKITDKITFKINAISVKDKMAYLFTEENLYKKEDTNVKNKGISLILNKHFSNKYKSSIIASYTNLYNVYNNENTLSGDGEKLYINNFNEIKDYSFKFLNSYKKAKNTLNFGYEFSLIKENATSINKEDIDEYYFFGDTATANTNSLFADYFYKRKEGFLKFSGRINYNNLTKKVFFEPGFLIGLKPFKNKSFSANFAGGIYYQNLNQIFNENYLNSEDYFWLLSRKSNNDDKSRLYSTVQSNQISAEIEKKLKSGQINISVFEKWISDIPSDILKMATDNPFNEVNLFVYGAEFSFGIKKKYYYAFTSYSYTKVNYNFESKFLSAEYEKPHVLSVMQGSNYKNFNLSANYNLSSGKPYTPYESIENEEDEETGEISYYLNYAEFNSARLPFYNRFDLSLSYKISIKKTKVKFAIGTINLFNNKNILKKRYEVENPDEDANQELKVLELNRMGMERVINFSILIQI